MRPTGLVDPEVEVRPATTQVDDVLSEITARVARGHRVLVTTLTKRMAEDLTDFLADHQVRVRYLHSDIDTVERVEIIRDLRLGVFDVLVGINLQTSFMTPPFGFSLIYLRGVAPASVTTGMIYRGAVPFVALQLIGLGIVMAFPELSTWLPAQVFRNGG